MNDCISIWAYWEIRRARRAAYPNKPVETQLYRNQLLHVGTTRQLFPGASLVVLYMNLINAFDHLPPAQREPMASDLHVDARMAAWVRGKVGEMRRSMETDPANNDGWVPGVVANPDFIAEAVKEFPTGDVVDLIFRYALYGETAVDVSETKEEQKPTT